MTGIVEANRRTNSVVVWIAFATFIGLGLSTGLRGVAWPSMRTEFGLPEDGLGVLIFIQTLGYIVSSFFSGRIASWLGNGKLYLLSSATMAAGLFFAFVAPSWGAFVAAGCVIGVASGLIDAGLNSYLAAHYGARQMNWMHACFGIGTTLGPLVMTTILNASLPWSTGYALSGVLLLGLALLYFVTLRLWRDEPADTSRGDTRSSVPLRATLRLPLLWLSVVLFMVYAGMEVGAGDWAYSLFTEAQGIAAEAAGLWVAVYWGSFTVGRLLFGVISDRFETVRLLRICMSGMVLGALLWWLNLSEFTGFFGLALLGFAQAPLFPLLILDTGNRLGERHAANAIGLQVSAAGVGIALLPALAGVLVARLGYDVLTPFILLLAVLVFVLNEAMLFKTAARRKTAVAANAG